MSSDRTEIREVVERIELRDSGPPTGVPGPPGPGAEVRHGEITVANNVWAMPHNLGIAEEDFNPASWWFENEVGTPMEPEEVQWSTPDLALAVWGTDPVRGTWIVN